MILTITINPSVDRLYSVKHLHVGTLNRVHLVKKMVGGKGINAARVASELGSKAIATGFLAGQNGEYILNEAKNDKYISDFIQIAGETRNCYTIIQNDKLKTEINESNTQMNLSDLDRLLDKIRLIINSQKINVVSINGSFPNNLPVKFYSSIMEIIRAINPSIKIILDTSGTALKDVLRGSKQPDYIKPNEIELAELLNQKVTTNPKRLKEYLEDTLFNSLDNIIVSLGGDGAVTKHHNNYYYINFAKVPVINTEGSGDSLVGGLLYALDKNFDYPDIIKYAIAAGTANAMETKTGFIKQNNVMKVMKTVTFKKL
ncbi:1-phosphofructokinase family hexose kinase [Bombilactobacillus bombi]|uniref:1-phosphofructokinase family hexose kinase n=1 Tax=Bombilactobacillus bombi TaxID=1303590 RepID=UPI0015E5CE0C|nr:1-phosphofructokinase family hexose kinase [Bombilactobacillus bombi]MBA1434108.1 1-phosphofructokinase family hexose kinase [Bombilactobacillus bombi]